MKRVVVFVIILTLLQLAAFGQKKKKYQAPVVATPANLDRDALNAQPDPRSVADLKWFEVFGDEKLQALIREALTANYDVRASVSRIDLARANYGLVRSNQLPTIGASADLVLETRSRNGSIQLPEPIPKARNFGSLLLNLFTFELDIWGKNRKATEAARSEVAATEDERRAVMTTIVADVATSYYNLRELDYELEIARNTLKSRQESLRL